MRHQVREGVMTSFIREKGLLFSFFLWFEDGQVCFYHMLFSLTSSTLIQVYDVSLVVWREDLISSRKVVSSHQTLQTMWYLEPSPLTSTRIYNASCLQKSSAKRFTASKSSRFTSVCVPRSWPSRIVANWPPNCGKAVVRAVTVLVCCKNSSKYLWDTMPSTKHSGAFLVLHLTAFRAFIRPFLWLTFEQ